MGGVETLSEYRTPEPDWRRVVEARLENFAYVPDGASDEKKRAERDSGLMNLGGLLLEEAARMAQDAGHSPGTYHADILLDRASDIFQGIFHAYGGLSRPGVRRADLDTSEIRRRLAVHYPAHPRRLIEAVRKDGRLDIDRDAFEHAVKHYLQEPIRTREIDRILLIALTDMEITAYIDEMEEKNVLSGKSKADLVRTPLAWVFLRGRLISLLVWVAIAAMGVVASLYWVGMPGWILPLMVLGSAAAFSVGTVIAATGYVLGRGKMKKARETVLGTMERMSAFYSEFRTEGPISLGYFETRLKDLASQGVVWPASVWALIEDSRQRGLTFV